MELGWRKLILMGIWYTQTGHSCTDRTTDRPKWFNTFSFIYFVWGAMEWSTEFLCFFLYIYLLCPHQNGHIYVCNWMGKSLWIPRDEHCIIYTFIDDVFICTPLWLTACAMLSFIHIFLWTFYNPFRILIH